MTNEITQEIAKFRVWDALRSFAVDANDALRKRVWRMIQFGVTQKAIAVSMDIPPSTFSKWLRAVDGIGPVSVNAEQGYNRFLEQLRQETHFDPSKMSPEEVERFNAATESLKTARVIKARQRKPVKARVGKKVAKG